MENTTSASTLSGQTKISKPKKSPLIILIIFFLITGLGFGGFFMLKNFGKTQASILDTNTKNENSPNSEQKIVPQKPEEVFLKIQNNILSSLEKQNSEQKDITYSTDTNLKIFDINSPVPLPSKVNSFELKMLSKNSQLKYDGQKQKLFLDGNFDFGYNLNFSSGKNNFDVGIKFLVDGKLWFGSGEGYIMTRKLGFDIKGFEKIGQMMIGDKLSDPNAINIKTNFENWLLGLKFVGASVKAIGNGLSGKVIYVSQEDIKHSLKGRLKENQNLDFSSSANEENFGDEKILEKFSGENYFKTIPLFVGVQSGDKYLLKSNENFTGGMLQQSLTQTLIKTPNLNSNAITKGILMAALTPRLAGAQGVARDTVRQTGLNQLQAGLEVYYSENGDYPSFENPSDVKNLSKFLSGIMSQIPSDPQKDKIWYYQSFNSGQNYIVFAQLETSERSNLENYDLSGKNVYLVKDNSGKQLDKKIIQKALENVPESQKKVSSEYFAYFQQLENDKFKIWPIDENMSGNYIIFSTKNILEFNIFNKDENGELNLVFKDGKLDGKIGFPQPKLQLNISGNYTDGKSNLKVELDGKNSQLPMLNSFVFESNIEKKNDQTKNITSIDAISMFGKLKFDSNTTIKNGKNFEINFPKKHDLKASQISGEVAKILINDPEIINIGLEFFTNQIVFGLQSKLDGNDKTNFDISGSGGIDINGSETKDMGSYSLSGNKFVRTDNLSGIKYGSDFAKSSTTGIQKIDLDIFSNMEKEMKDQMKTEQNISGFDPKILEDFFDKMSGNILKISLIKGGLKNYFYENGIYPESSFSKVSSISELEKYYESLPQDIFYKSISKDGQKNACYIILTASKGKMNNTNLESFKDFMNIENFEQYQKILNYSGKGKFYVSSCE